MGCSQGKLELTKPSNVVVPDSISTTSLSNVGSVKGPSTVVRLAGRLSFQAVTSHFKVFLFV